MFKRLFFSTALLFGLATGVQAQHGHSDVELGYDNLTTPTKIIVEQDEVTLDGIQFFESAFEELDPFTPGDFSSDEPGFTTNFAEGLLVNPNDQLFLTALDASTHSSFGVGYVNFYNPLTDSLEASGRLAVQGNSGSFTDLILNGGAVESGSLEQFVGLGDGGGDIHDHVIVDLLDDGTAPMGAYGILFQLESDFATGDGTMDVSSDPFWIVWNHGMSDADFDEKALVKFGANAVPEPGSAAVLVLLSSTLAFVRRRKA